MTGTSLSARPARARRPSGPAPAEPATPSDASELGSGSVVSLARPKRRRPSWVLLGVVLVGLAALVGAYVFQAMSDTVRIVVAARDLPPGEPIGAGDLRVVELGRTAALRAIQPDQQDVIVGLAPTGPVPAGTVLNTGLFVPLGEVVPAGQVVFGAALEAGAVPTPSVGPGDVVTLVAAVDTSAGVATGVDDASEAPRARVLGPGTVFAVEGSAVDGSVSARVWVSVLIDEDLLGAAAQAAADGRLRLAVSGRDG